MIQANELRIGNIVTVDNRIYHPTLKDVPLKIIEIQRTQGLHIDWTYAVGLKTLSEDPFSPRYSQLLEFIRPITLTEEKLLKAGFEKDIGSLFYRNSFIIAKTKTRWAFYHNGLTSGELVRIDYVHDLQNTIFALTGEEIKIEV